MRTLNSELEKLNKNDDCLVQMISTNSGYESLPHEKLASEMTCKFCGTNKGWSFLEDGKRIWFCGLICEASKLPFHDQTAKDAPNPKRSIEWPLFCEISSIGDTCHNIRFELIQQSSAKLEFIKNFCHNPNSLIMMSGKAGTGKTYMSLGVLELFTRKSKDCMFFTQKSLMSKWMETFKAGLANNFIERVTRTSLLVIDDFGTCEPSPGFLSFFMELIDNRLQWSKRGTIITTNLTPDKLSQFCGEALVDRFKTGQVFEFKGNSRREKKPL